jgi:5-methylcytosine-specific restriction enzyme subunit McrC
MFDMNLLWERFIYHSLRKNGLNVSYQNSKEFWKLPDELKVNIRPDLVIESKNKKYIIDTKWKILKDSRPSDDDLKQMFAYSHYFQSSHTVLCYPGVIQAINSGTFSMDYEFNKCSTLEIPVNYDINEWTIDIKRTFEEKVLN